MVVVWKIVAQVSSVPAFFFSAGERGLYGGLRVELRGLKFSAIMAEI